MFGWGSASCHASTHRRVHPQGSAQHIRLRKWLMAGHPRNGGFLRLLETPAITYAHNGSLLVRSSISVLW